MINGEKYKTADERNAALDEFCKRHSRYCLGCPICRYDEEDSECDMFKWLELEVEEEKPMSCPYCGGDCSAETVRELDNETNEKYSSEAVICYGHDGDLKHGCGYTSMGFDTKIEAIVAHNHICKAVAAYKEAEVK